MKNIMNIGAIDCYEKNGTANLRLETAARGQGFTPKGQRSFQKIFSTGWQ